MKSAFSLEKQQIIPSPQNVVIGHGILLLRSLCGQPSGLSGPSLSSRTRSRTGMSLWTSASTWTCHDDHNNGDARPGPPCHQAARSCPGVDPLRVVSRVAGPNEEIWLLATRFSRVPTRAVADSGSSFLIRRSRGRR